VPDSFGATSISMRLRYIAQPPKYPSRPNDQLTGRLIVGTRQLNAGESTTPPGKPVMPRSGSTRASDCYWDTSGATSGRWRVLVEFVRKGKSPSSGFLPPTLLLLPRSGSRMLATASRSEGQSAPCPA
jgi:hypothetical protein